MIWCKLEFMNPSGLTKDRIAAFILGKALRRGEIAPGGTVVEASSGSTSIAMALAAAQLGLRFVAVMPEGVSRERRQIIEAYGGRVVFTPGPEGITARWPARSARPRRWAVTSRSSSPTPTTPGPTVSGRRRR